MKVFVVLLSVIALGASAPQPRKLFHEHVEDFLDIIREDIGDELDQLMGQYLQFEEYKRTLEYISSAEFKNLINEMEALPEFVNIIQFLEADNIDILFFVDLFNEMIEQVPESRKLNRIEASGTDFHSFIADSISLFPKEKLAALFEEKQASDEAFKTAVNNLYGDEWHNTLNALFASESFASEIATLDEHGLNIHDFLGEIKAIFGQE